MKTLIELYDERAIENVLGVEMFHPERVVYLCPTEVAKNLGWQKKLTAFFRKRGISAETLFLETSLYNTEKIEKQLRSVISANPDCAIDITGGTDAALFASGTVCQSENIPAFTYSRKKNCFYNIKNASFAENLECTVTYPVEDFFLMAGGAMREGRVDNRILNDYCASFDEFFRIYLKFRSIWNSQISWFQKASACPKGTLPSLTVLAAKSLRTDHSGFVKVKEELLLALQSMGYLDHVNLVEDRVSFRFRDQQVRTWLRDVGSVLELIVYKACLDTGIFDDVYNSAVVDWEGDFQHDNVSNEIDVMASKGIMPIFISCKTCEVDADALNELAILKDRFGGAVSRAAIVTTQKCGAIMRNRASELQISVIDIDHLSDGALVKELRKLVN